MTDDAAELFDFDARAVEIDSEATGPAYAALRFVGVCIAFAVLVGLCAAVAVVLWYILYGAASVVGVTGWIFGLL